MLWKNYVFRMGDSVHDLWDDLFRDRVIRLLYICGRGFDVRAQKVLSEFLQNMRSNGHKVEEARLLLVGLTGYELDDALIEQTEQNAREIQQLFREIGSVHEISFDSSLVEETDLSASNILSIGMMKVLSHVGDQTDIILDVSSLPRTVYLTLLTAILHKVMPIKTPDALGAKGINFQVLVGQDASLDGRIQSDDPSNDLVLIPGYSSALYSESMQDWPLVWFPILGENRMGQFEKVMVSVIPDTAEICPVVPHPSNDLRRGDKLLVEYMRPLFGVRKVPTTNILYAHENNPFEAYRQMYSAMCRYRDSLNMLGGCRLVVTPLGSKLITLGVGLACFEVRPPTSENNYGIAIPQAEPKRYITSLNDLRSSKPEIASLLLTGEAYM